jgi:hypothetical protein
VVKTLRVDHSPMHRRLPALEQRPEPLSWLMFALDTLSSRG